MHTRMNGGRHKQRNISSVCLYLYINRLYIKTDAQFYVKQRFQSSVLMKQGKKNSFKCCHQFVHGPLVRMRYI